jgi:hypothetical protein
MAELRDRTQRPVLIREDSTVLMRAAYRTSDATFEVDGRRGGRETCPRSLDRRAGAVSLTGHAAGLHLEYDGYLDRSG